jgi:hypothetical protein
VNIYARLYNYYSDKYLDTQLKRGRSAIYSAILKYGRSKFKLEILEYCDPSNCIAREQFYLYSLCTVYNILQTAGSPLGVIASEETKIKISKALKGRSLSEETRAKISASMVGNSNSIYQAQKIEVTDLELKTKTTFGSIREAARALNIPHFCITKYFSQNQKKPYIKRYVFTKHS